MRFFQYIICSLLLIPTAARADQPVYNTGRSAMHYERVTDVPKADDSLIKIKTVRRDDSPASDAKPEETPQTRIWNKYKALAAGEAGSSDAKKTDDKASAKKNDASEQDETSDSAESPKTIIEKQPADPTGIAAIIDEYKRNKQRRSDMHTIVVTPPAEAEKEEKKIEQKKEKLEEEKIEDEKPQG